MASALAQGVQRRTVRFGIRHGDAAAGLELARALAMTTYRSAEEFSARFSAPAQRVDGSFDDAGRVIPVRAGA